MPTPSEELYDNLYQNGSSALALAVAGRIYPVRVSELETRLPCVVFRRVFSSPEGDSHSGWSGMLRCRWSFDCWALTHYEAEALADTLRLALAAAPLAAQQVTVHDADAGADQSLWRVIVEAYTWRDEEA
jgi:hypothetical protein